MPLEGSISVNVQFRDTTSSTGVQSLKTITLQEGTEYTTGKVAVLTGTAGTSQVSFSSIGATTYRDSAGNLVSFNSVQRVAFSWSGASERILEEVGDSYFKMRSNLNRISLSDVPVTTVAFNLSQGVGTGTYTIVLYGTS